MAYVQSERTRKLAADVASLRGRGLPLAEIAAQLDISVPYASGLLRDPTGERRRERRRELPPAPAAPGEFDADELAWLLSILLRSAVSPSAVMKAHRRGAISSRKGPNGTPLFRGSVVLQEIDDGRWKPHRSLDATGRPLRGQGWVTETCANGRCTCGESGGRSERTIRRSHHQRLADPWVCCDACAEAVGGKRRRAERRRCGCLIADEPCPNWIPITRYQKRHDSGPRKCDECNRAGRKTERQRASARAALDALRDTDASRAHRAKLAAVNGQRNSYSAERMDNLIGATMRARGKTYTDEMSAGVRRRARRRAQTGRTDKLDARIRELWAAGVAGEEIASRLRITPRRFWRIHARLGLPNRPRGRRRKEILTPCV